MRPVPLSARAIRRHLPGLARNRAALFLLLSGLLAGCTSRADNPRPNERPGVRLTGGPVAGEKAEYDAEFFWAGWDSDGIVDHYQYVIDVPRHFSAADLDNPEDTGIAWRDTAVVRARFRFTTPDPDSVICEGGLTCFSGYYDGHHSIHIRSVDNEGMTSTATGIEFDPRTLVPISRIVSPRVVDGGPGYIRVGRQVRFCWTGEDPDARTAHRRPASYQWKLIKVASILTLEDANYAVLEDPGPNFEWHTVDAQAPCVSISLETPQSYLFAVRAIDDVGGTEQSFEFGRNALKMQASGSNVVGRPVLTVRERSLGTIVFPQDGDIVDFEVAAGACLRFSYSGNADVYGGEIQGFDTCVDVVDDLAEESPEGCSGLSLIPYSLHPICFPEPGIHVISVRCRDSGGGMTVGRLRLTVVDFPRDREILYVDDSYDLGDFYLTDGAADHRLKGALAANGVSSVDEFHAFGLDDRDGNVSVPRLSDLARFRLVFWSVNGVGGGGSPGESALLRASSCATGRILQAYVGAGGAVWIFGQRPMASLKLNPTGGLCRATTTYDQRTGLEIVPGDFACDYLHFCPRDIRTTKTGSGGLGLLGAKPTAEAAAEGFPVLSIDPATYATDLGGLLYYDAQLQRFDSPDPGLDTLYTSETARPTALSGRPIAWRYAGADPRGEQGAVALFGFPIQNLMPGTTGAGGVPGEQLQGMVGTMLEWFRRNQRGSRGAEESRRAVP